MMAIMSACKSGGNVDNQSDILKFFGFLGF